MTNDQLKMTNSGTRNKILRHIHLTFVIMTFVITTAGGLGCARTMTQVFTYGERVVVEATFAGNVDVNANRYFLVMSSSAGLKVPLPPPDNLSYHELIEPGTIPYQGSITDYYTNYYSTWGGYIVAEPAGYFASAGPFIQNQSSTRELLGTLSETTSKLTFNFRLDQIFNGTTPETVYIDIVAVPWPVSAVKIPVDHLTTTNFYISRVSGSTITISDDQNDIVDPALNIIQAKATVL